MEIVSNWFVLKYSKLVDLAWSSRVLLVSNLESESPRVF